jgi:alkylation response protein AidB-like acyl-CoA dehydrogenase
VTRSQLLERLEVVCGETLPCPGSGRTAKRHTRLLEFGREDLSLARLAEAHFDALAILEEAGRKPEPNKLYGVWASERRGREVTVQEGGGEYLLSGQKPFASGAGLVARALVTAGGEQPLLFDVDLRANENSIDIDLTDWKASAFAQTNTGKVTFRNLHVPRQSLLCDRGWYLKRIGFWHGACGPAACWAGGAIGLIDSARTQSRSDPHTLAHLGAMEALAWSMRACLETAGSEIDAQPQDALAARLRALMLRHVVEQGCVEISERFARAYGPHPLAYDADILLRHQELALYLRQCHGERDLEGIGEAMVALPILK